MSGVTLKDCSGYDLQFSRASGHDGEGWYYHWPDYPDEGCVGRFGTLREARTHAVNNNILPAGSEEPLDMSDVARRGRIAEFVGENGAPPEDCPNLPGEESDDEAEHWIDLLLRLTGAGMANGERVYTGKPADVERQATGAGEWLFDAELDDIVENILAETDGGPVVLSVHVRRSEPDGDA